MLSQFGPDNVSGKQKYREFVTKGLELPKKNPFTELYGQVILGSKEFIKKIKESVKESDLDKEIVERKRLTDYVTPGEILEVVTKYFKTNMEALRNQRSRNNTAKKVAIYLIKRYSGLTFPTKLFRTFHYH